MGCVIEVAKEKEISEETKEAQQAISGLLAMLSSII